MPDHWHGLIQLGEDDSLSKRIGLLKSNTARCLKLAEPDIGRVWDRSFQDHALRDEREELLDTARYLVMNPVRAGLVTRIGNYSYWDAVWVCG